MSAPLTDDAIIIDDDRGVIEVLEMYCENLGVFRNIIKARDGSEASKKLANQKFSLILLDINMPKKSGVDIIKELEDKNHPNDLSAVIIVSGELNKTILAESMKRGAKNFIVKPFDETQFRDKVKGVLGKTRPDLVIP
jgi:two-component system chemotaxis response regulator CheY